LNEDNAIVPVASGELSVQNITHVDILGRMDRTLPTSGARHSDDLPMDTLPLNVFVKVQDISTDTPEDVSTASVVFPIGSSCELDQQVDETGVGIVSSFSSVVIPVFHAFLFSRLAPFLDHCRTKVMRWIRSLWPNPSLQ
jgi:hypothetical protein